MIETKKEIFISHAVADEYIAGLFKQWIESLFPGIRVFIASADTRGGEVWAGVLRQRIPSASVILTILSPRSINSHWVLFESGTGFLANHVIPICIDGIKPYEITGPFSILQARELNPLELERVIKDIEEITEVEAILGENSCGQNYRLVEEVDNYIMRRQLGKQGIDNLFKNYKMANLLPPGHSIYEEDNGVIVNYIINVVSTEEPIHQETVLKRIRSIYGLKRAGAAVRTLFQKALQVGLQEGAIKWDSEYKTELPQAPFLCITQNKAVEPRRSVDLDNGLSWRTVDEVSLREIEAGLLLVKKELFLDSHEQILREAARQFGFTKMTLPIRKRFIKAASNIGKAGLLNDLSKW